jgi:hypothetical protein
MTPLSALLIPIVASAAIVFLASSVIHMVLPWHKGDFPKLENEDRIMDAMRPLNLAPGDYMIPRPASMEDMKSAAFQEKAKKGPVLVMTVFPNGMQDMTRNLGMWFVYCIVVSIFTAYITGTARPPQTPYLKIFQIAGATAFTGYAVALWQLTIWYRRSARITLTSTFDGLIYALLTAGTFGWLWPK